MSCYNSSNLSVAYSCTDQTELRQGFGSGWDIVIQERNHHLPDCTATPKFKLKQFRVKKEASQQKVKTEKCAQDPWAYIPR